MIATLRRLLAAPTFPNPGQTRRARIVHALILIHVLVIFFSGAAALIFVAGLLSGLIFLAVQFLLLAALLWLLMRQQQMALAQDNQEAISRRAAETQNTQLKTRLDTATNELALARAELEAYSFSVSHDLRAPLNALQGFSALLKERTAASLDEKSQQYLDRIVVAGERMHDLLNHLLALAKISRTPLAWAELDLSKMAEEVAARLSGQLAQASPGRKVVWQIAGDMRVAGDAARIGVVLENMLGNALKYTAKCDRAVIALHEAGRSGEHIEFLVSDNGVGFDNAHAGQLFMPFRRLHSERDFSGAGIGLATASRILAMHGGGIRGDGAVNGGARFWFTLPVARVNSEQ